RGAVKLYRDFAPTAHRELLGGLRPEPEEPEVAPGAEEEFRQKVAAALLTIVPLGRNRTVKRQGRDETESQTERWSLIDFCDRFAGDRGWAGIRSYAIWCRKDAGRLRVALRCELFGQFPGC